MQKVGDEKLSASTLADRLDVSNLTYLAQDDANVVVERTQKIQYADSPEYKSNGQIVVNWQTGNDFISGRDSMLRLKVTATGGAGASLEKGFITNIFNRVRVVTRSGVVVSHIDKYNLLTYYKTKYSRTKAWRTQQGVGLLGNGGSIANDGTNEYLIPLSLVAPIFDTNMLLPASLVKGLRLEIKLERPEIAFVTAGDYEVAGVQCILDSYRLSDGAQNLINNESKNRGLIIQYHDYQNSSFTLDPNQTTASLDVRKTASMAVGSMAILRRTPEGKDDDIEAKIDSFASKVYEAGRSYQWRIGSTYLPVQAVAGPVQGYAQAAYCFSKLNHKKELGVEFKEWSEEQHNGQNVMCCDISRYWLQNSGLAISNSTSLNFNLEGVDGTDGKKLDIFLTHVRSLQVFLENVVRSD